MAIEDKYDSVKRLIVMGKERGYLLYELAFETGAEAAGSLDEARSCLRAMQRRKLESELRTLQQQIKQAEQAKQAKELRELLVRKQELSRALSELR